MQYQIVTGNTDQPYIGCAIRSLREQVEHAISEGWEPVGGVALHSNASPIYTSKIAIQAMIKRDPPLRAFDTGPK